MISFINSSGDNPSISFSGVKMMRCLITGIAISMMSSGVTKSLPIIAACALADFKIARDARGEAPRYNEELLLVSFTIFAMKATSFGSIITWFVMFLYVVI